MTRRYAYLPFNRNSDMFMDCMRADPYSKGNNRYPAGRLIIYKSKSRLDLDYIYENFLTKHEKEKLLYPAHCTRDEACRAFGRKRFLELVEEADFESE